MKDLLGFFEEDWRKVPANYRYVFFAGTFLIVMAWLGDHWGDQLQYHLPLFESNEFAFQIGFCVIGLFFIILVAKQIRIWQKILFLRRRYPSNNLNEGFYLVSFQNSIYLLDNKTKIKFHLKTPQTVEDLGFKLLGWIELSHDINPSDEITLGNTDKKIKWNDYKEVAGGIFTQP